MASPADFISTTVDRLDRDHGRILVSRALGLLAASHNGLAESELLAILSDDAAVIDELRERFPLSPATAKVPWAVWTRFFYDAESYLAKRYANDMELLIFGSHEFRSFVEREWESEIGQRHTQIAHHFSKRYDRSKGTATIERRVIDELPWQLASENDWLRLSKLLGLIPFFNAFWERDSEFLIRAWRLIHQESPYRATDAYRSALEKPHEFESETLLRLHTLFNSLGCLGQAEIIGRSLGENRQLNAKSALGLRMLENKATQMESEGRLTDALACCREIAESLQELGDKEATAAALDRAAAVCMKMGDYSEALQLTEDSERLYRTTKNISLLAGSLLIQANCYFHLSNGKNLFKCLREASQLYIDEGDPSGYGQCMELFAQAYEAMDLDERCHEYFTLAERAFRACDDFDHLGGALHNRASYHFRRGRLEDALQDLNQAEVAFSMIEQTRGIAFCYYLRSRVLASTDPIGAWRSSRSALRLSTDNGFIEIRDQALIAIEEARRRCIESSNVLGGGQPTEVRECGIEKCDNVGRFIAERIIRVGGKNSEITGWCAECQTVVCLACAGFMPSSPEALLELPKSDPLRGFCLQRGILPATPKCPICDWMLGQGSQPVYVIDEQKPNEKK